MLAFGNDVSIDSGATANYICVWEADGVKEFAGFLATGDVPAEYRLLVEGNVVYKFRTKSADETAQVVDKPWIPEAAQTLELRAVHYSGAACVFSGTILGG